MAEILEALPNLGGLPLLVELTGSCPTFSGGNWGKFGHNFLINQPFGTKFFLISHLISILDSMVQVSEPLELIFSLYNFGEVF